MATTPKRHHYVPRAYLDRFSHDGKVYVRWRDGRSYATNPINVAVESGFYDIPDRQGGKSSALEELLADIDRMAIDAMRRIDASGRPPSADEDDRTTLAMFLAVQSTRTPESRLRLEFPQEFEKYAAGRPVTKDLVAQFLREIHLRFEPSDGEIQGAFDFATLSLGDGLRTTATERSRLMFANVGQVAQVLAAMTWIVETDRKQNLATSDSPLVLWRTPTVRDRFEGFGVMNAEEIRFPLDPGKQLVLTRAARPPTKRITPDRAHGCSKDTAAACYRFIVGSPRRHALLNRMPMSSHRPVLRFNVGPRLVQRHDGSYVKTDDEILHMWIQRR